MTNTHQLQGSWNRIRGQIKEKWDNLSDGDLDQAAGKRDQVIGRLQARYGWQRDQAERELDTLTHTW